MSVEDFAWFHYRWW